MTTSSQVITCKGAVCWGIGEGVKVEEIQVDPPKASEVRVKMLCASVCHTDIFSTQGYLHANYPQVLGHEGIGVVESKGEGVKNVEVGDVVIPLYVSECGECEVCMKGKTNLCMKYPIMLSGLMPDNTSRMSVRGHKAYHLMSCATWCEYMVIDANYVLKVDPAMDAAHGSFISCGFSTGFGAAWKEAMVEKGSSIAVFGLGAVGLGAVSAAKLMGATKIIGIDKNEKKREKGEAFGMTDFINPDKLLSDNKTVSQQVKEFSGEMGVDYSIECTGVPFLLNEAMESTKVGVGKTVAVGTGAESVQLSYATILYGRTLKGCAFGGIKPISDLPFIAHKCHTKEIPIQELLTHEIKLEDIGKAFELMKHPECVKVVVNM